MVSLEFSSKVGWNRWWSAWNVLLLHRLRQCFRKFRMLRVLRDLAEPNAVKFHPLRLRHHPGAERRLPRVSGMVLPVRGDRCHLHWACRRAIRWWYAASHWIFDIYVVSRTVECQQFAQSVFIVIFVGQFQNRFLTRIHNHTIALRINLSFHSQLVTSHGRWIRVRWEAAARSMQTFALLCICR